MTRQVAAAPFPGLTVQGSLLEGDALTKSKSSHSFRGFSEDCATSRAVFHFRRHAGL